MALPPKFPVLPNALLIPDQSGEFPEDWLRYILRMTTTFTEYPA